MFHSLLEKGFVVFDLATAKECDNVLSLVNKVLNDEITDLIPYKLIHTSSQWPNTGNKLFRNPYFKDDTVRHLFPKNDILHQFTSTITKRLNEISNHKINWNMYNNISNALEVNIVDKNGFLPEHIDADWGKGTVLYFAVLCLNPAIEGGISFITASNGKKHETKLKKGQCLMAKNYPHGLSKVTNGLRISCVFRSCDLKQAKL